MTKVFDPPVTVVHEAVIPADHPLHGSIQADASYTFEEAGSAWKTTWTGCRPVERDGAWVFNLRAEGVVTTVEAVQVK